MKILLPWGVSVLTVYWCSCFPVVEPFKRIYLFPLRSEEEDTVCFDIDILQNSVDEDDYGSFKLHIDVGSDLNVWVPRDRAYVPVHVEPAVGKLSTYDP